MSDNTNNIPDAETIEQLNALQSFRHRQIILHLRWISVGAWLAAGGAIGWWGYWWGFLPLRYAFFG